MKKHSYITMIVVGVIIFILLILLNIRYVADIKYLNGISAIIAGIMISIGYSGILSLEANKNITKEEILEYSDERANMIRLKSKAKMADISHYFFMAIIFVAIVFNAPFLLILSIGILYSIYVFMLLYYYNKYDKNM